MSIDENGHCETCGRIFISKEDAVSHPCKNKVIPEQPDDLLHEAYQRFLDYGLDGSQNINRTPAQYNDILIAFKAGTAYGATMRESGSRDD